MFMTTYVTQRKVLLEQLKLRKLKYKNPQKFEYVSEQQL